MVAAGIALKSAAVTATPCISRLRRITGTAAATRDRDTIVERRSADADVTRPAA